MIVPARDRPRTRSTYHEGYVSEPTVDNERVVDLEETQDNSAEDKQSNEEMLLEPLANSRRKRLATSHFPTYMGLV